MFVLTYIAPNNTYENLSIDLDPCVDLADVIEAAAAQGVTTVTAVDTAGLSWLPAEGDDYIDAETAVCVNFDEDPEYIAFLAEGAHY